ncbi:MAG TPA: hypothetical protein H9902_06780 [Candidatus Stackebrandtia faecavium]|nr:hypothetical protein [Candidatus Stackebrandtia faecavium]
MSAAAAMFALAAGAVFGVDISVPDRSDRGTLVTAPNRASSPKPQDPQELEQWRMTQAQQALEANASALLDENKTAWLSLYDEPIQADLGRRFDSLHTMQVSQFEYQFIDEAPDAKDDGTFELRLAANYCLGGVPADDCDRTSIFFDTSWSDSASQLRITEVDESHERGPRPWEVTALEAVSDARTIVAAPPEYAHRLDEMLPMAEEAARNADKYARFGQVDRYIFYLAGDEEFDHWYGLEKSSSLASAFMVPLTQARADGQSVPGGANVVVNQDKIANAQDFRTTLRHEAAHVVLDHEAPVHDRQPEEWWLSEGMAELVQHGHDTDVSQYLRMSDVREYVSSGGWDGSFTEVTDSDEAAAASAKYGIAFYGTYYLYTEYGDDEFMDFFEQVARNGVAADTASRDVFGRSYQQVESEMAEFVHATVSA